MAILLLLGRILYGGFFIISGYKHFANHAMLTGYTKSKGLPNAGMLVYLSGLFLLLGGLGVVLGVEVIYSLTLIIIFLFIVSIKMHAYWIVSDPNQKMMEAVQFKKNIALLGAALMLIATYQSWTYSF